MAKNTNTELEASDASAILSKICDLFHIGKMARTESTILVNVKNVIDHARLLHAVERDLFPQPELPEDDDPYATVDDELPAPNSWAAKDEADYVAQFRAALAARASLSLPAAGQEPVDYAPMLDDDGREMVVNSHHYTADNIRALVAEYKALEANAPGSWLKHHNTDHCTRAGVLWRILSALADEVPLAAPPTAQAEGWMPIETAPKDGTHIIAYRPSSPPHIECMNWCAYEDADIPGAWHWAYDGDAPRENPPTHWMPLPEDPPTSSADTGKGE